MSGAEQALADLREVACMPPGVKAPLSQASAVGALWTIDSLNAELDHARAGVAEWRTLALSLQAQVKHQADCRESELVTLLKDILHCSDVFATFRPDLHARLLDSGRRLKAQEPRDDFPDDYEV